MHRFVLLLALVGTAAQSALAQDSIRESVVKIHCTQRLPNFLQPWAKGNTNQVSGSGAIIEGNRILTNAHVVLYASQIRVQANQSTERVPATVEAIAPGIDLAVLKLSDEGTFEERPPLQLADGLPRIRDTVNAYGFPIGGEQMSVTEGIISRVEYTPFAFGMLGLRIQVDAALNSGNSGGPAIAGGKIVGLVFSTIQNADNIGYLIPADEIRMFLDDIQDGTYDGQPIFPDHLQTVENVSLRARLRLDDATGGLMVTRPHSEDESYPLKEWDVITHIGDEAIDKQGNIGVGDELRLSFRYLIPKLVKDGKVPVTVFRDGASLPLEVPLKADSELLIPYLMGAYPPYFIVGPMVFTTSSQELLNGMGGGGQATLVARQNPLISRRFDRITCPDEELVLLGARMFSSPLSEGYDPQSFGVVTHVNDVAISNLVHLVETIRKAEGEFIVFKVAGAYETLVFNRQELLDSSEQILEDEGIRYQMSAELRAIWEPK